MHSIWRTCHGKGEKDCFGDNSPLSVRVWPEEYRTVVDVLARGPDTETMSEGAIGTGQLSFLADKLR